jgi:hypothetical protein
MEDSLKDLAQRIADMQKSFSAIKLPSLTYNIPRISMAELPSIPTMEERHAYESSGALLKRLIERIRMWRTQCPKDAQPVILAILPNGSVINVHTLGQEGHNGIVITGKLDDTDCMYVAHQTNLGLLCFIEKVDEDKKKYKIGFCVEGQESQE